MEKNKFEKYLKTKKIYIQGINSKVRVTTPDMFSVNDGWYQLLHDCFEELFKKGWSGNLLQVKEKFGGLRIYIYDNAFQEIILKYEKDSFSICELCGVNTATTINHGGWLTTLCQECQNTLNNVKNNNAKQLLSEDSETTETS